MSFLSNLFSGPSVNFTPASFSSPGVSASFSGNKYNVTQSPQVSADVTGASQASQNEADILGGLRATVGPGFNDLLNARLQDQQNNALAAISNLKENLAARRILGSSFGNNTLMNLQTQQQQQRDQIIADNFLKSLAANQKLTQQQFDAARQAYAIGLNQLNFESSLAADLTGKANSALASAAQAQAQLDAAAQTGAGKLIGSALGTVLAPTGTQAGNLIAKSIFG